MKAIVRRFVQSSEFIQFLEKSLASKKRVPLDEIERMHQDAVRRERAAADKHKE